MFGQYYACEGFPWDVCKDRPDPIWERLGKDVAQNLSRSVVLVSSFKGDFCICSLLSVAVFDPN